MTVELDLSIKEFGPGKVGLLIFRYPKGYYCDRAFKKAKCLLCGLVCHILHCRRRT